MNYREFPTGQLLAENAKRQNRLLPLNLIVFALAIVAAFSLLFAPIVSVDMGALGKALTQAVDSTSSSSGSSSESKEFVKVIFESLDGVSYDITAVDMLNSVTAADKSAAFSEDVGELMEKMEKTIVVTVLVGAFGSGGSTKDVDVDKVYSKLKALESVSSQTEKQTAVTALADAMCEELNISKNGDDRANMVEQINTLYDDTVADNNGKFTVEACICIQVSKGLDNGSGTPATTYDALISKLLNDSSSSSSSSAGATVTDALKYDKYMLIAIAVIALLWLVLAIFALVHAFTKNRRFTMWYVKLFGFLPCLLFGVLPLVAKGLFVGLVGGEAGAVIGTLLGAISTLTWISGSCYILLWLLSIFYAFPIKRKIRKVNKELKFRGVDA